MAYKSSKCSTARSPKSARLSRCPARTGMAECRRRSARSITSASFATSRPPTAWMAPGASPTRAGVSAAGGGRDWDGEPRARRRERRYLLGGVSGPFPRLLLREKYYATFPVAPEVVDLNGGADSSGTAPSGTVHELFSSLSLSSAPDGLPLLHCHKRLARPMETYLRGHVVTVYARCVTCYAVWAMWLGGAHATKSIVTRVRFQAPRELYSTVE